MRPQIGRHLASILEEVREYASIRVDDRIRVIKHVKVSGAVVSIDHDFDAVANVVERVSGDVVMC